MKRIALGAAVLAALSALAACGTPGVGGGVGQEPVSQGPSTLVKGKTPAQLYAHVARLVRACWLDPRDPVFRKHVFYGEAKPGGRSGNAASISIHERARGGERGLKVFSIAFKPVQGGTHILAENQKMDYALGQKLVSDVGYWAQGGDRCDGPVPPAQSHPQIEGPRVSR